MGTALTAAAATAASVETAASMDMTSMMDIMLVLLYIGYGIYSLYSYHAQRKAKVLLANKLICPGNCDLQKCRKPEEFAAFILPRTLLLGIGLLLFGGLFILDHFFGNNNPWLALALILLPLALFAWYVLEQRKAVKRFW